MKKEPARILSFDLARIIAVLAVIMIHISGWYVYAYERGSAEFLLGNLLDSMSRIAVPIFLMISGALMLDETKEVSIGKLLGKNIKTIALLFVFWSLFYVLTDCIIDPLLRGNPLDLKEIVTSLIEGHYHMWYLYMIIGLYLITPFLRCFVSKANKNLVLLFIGISLVVQFSQPLIRELAFFYPSAQYVNEILEMFHLDFFCGYTTYYLAGWYIYHVGFDKKWQKTALYAVSAIGLIMTILYVQKTKDYPNAYDQMNVFVFGYSIGAFHLINNLKIKEDNKFVKPLTVLSNLSFGVYIIHPFFQSAFEKLVPYNDMPVLYIFANFITISVLSFATSYVMSKVPVLKKLVRM